MSDPGHGDLLSILSQEIRIVFSQGEIVAFRARDIHFGTFAPPFDEIPKAVFLIGMDISKAVGRMMGFVGRRRLSRTVQCRHAQNSHHQISINAI